MTRCDDAPRVSARPACPQEGLCVARAEGRPTTFRVRRKERSQTSVGAAGILCLWVGGDKQLSELWMRHSVALGGLCSAP